MKLILNLAALGLTVYSGRPTHKTLGHTDTPKLFVQPGEYSVSYGEQSENTQTMKLRKTEKLIVGCDLRFNQILDTQVGTPGANSPRPNQTDIPGHCPQADAKYPNDHTWSNPAGLTFFLDSLEGPGARNCLVQKKAGGFDGAHYGVNKKYWGRVSYGLTKATTCEHQPTPGDYKVEYIDYSGEPPHTFKEQDKKLKIGCDLRFTNENGDEPSTGYYNITAVPTNCGEAGVGSRPNPEFHEDDFEATDPEKFHFFVDGTFGPLRDGWESPTRDCLFMESNDVILGAHYGSEDGGLSMSFDRRVRFTLETKAEC